MAAPVIFVIGYGPGVSSGIVEVFSSKGFKIGIAGRSERKLVQAAKELCYRHVHVATATLDAVSEASVQKGLDELSAELGAPNIVVYNAASIGAPGEPLGPMPVEEMTPEIFEEHWRIDALGSFLVARWAVKNLKEYDGKKTILFTGGALSLYPSPPLAGLAGGKAAQRNLAKVYHDVYKPQGIHVGLVTICNQVVPDDAKYNPKSIAKVYWTLYEEREKDSWNWEVQY